MRENNKSRESKNQNQRTQTVANDRSGGKQNTSAREAGDHMTRSSTRGTSRRRHNGSDGSGNPGFSNH